MAGGSGTRFWPESRKRRPKQFLKITGDRPMIQMTYERLKPDVPDEKVMLLIGRGHLEATKSLFENKKVHILTEPVGRNTAPLHGPGGPVCQAPAGEQ
jgi:mannose-1-phosphate guanylyltransferase